MAKLKFDPNDLSSTSDAPASLDQQDFSLSKKSSKLPVLVGIIVLLAVGGVLMGLHMASEHSRLLAHAAFLERFQSLEKNDVGNFWVCLLGPNADPSMFSDNLVLGQRVNGAFSVDPMHYPDKVLDDCVPKIIDAAKKLDDIGTLPEYTDAITKFRQALMSLGEGTKHWAERAKTYAVEIIIERKVDQGATGFHGLENQTPPPDTVAYVNFLRCSIPAFETSDVQHIVELLFLECKKPEFMAKLYQCGKLMNVTDGKPDKLFKSALNRIGPDEREQTALADCFKKGRKEAHRDDLGAFGKAWVAYMEAGGEVRKIGAANLKK